MKLPGAFTQEKYVNVVIESPNKSRNKYEYDKDSGLFRLKKVLAPGLVFPCDFGFIPGTLGEDGDPLDAMVIMDEMTYPGCLIECRLLGVIKVLQKKKEEKQIRNDRFLMVPYNMKEHKDLQSITDISPHKLEAITGFFMFYNSFGEKEIRIDGIAGPAEAAELILRQTE